MGYLEGLLGGFQGRKADIEKQNYERSIAAGEREGRIFEALLAHPDQDVRDMALTGLLESAAPKRRSGGLRGWMGELEQSPYLGKVRGLLQTPVSETRQTLPSTQTAAGVQLAPAVQPRILEAPAQEAAAGMPTTALTEQKGQPPPTPTTYTQAPPTPYTVTRARQGFPSPEAQARQRAIATQQGDVEGRVAGFVAAGGTREEGLNIERARMRGASLGISHVAVELPDGSQRMAVFDARRGQYLDPDTQLPFLGARPLSRTASSSWGVELEPLAMAVFGKRGNQLSQAEASVLLEAKQQQKNQLTTQQALSQASRMLPNTTVDQQMALADYLRSSTQAETAAPGGSAPAVGGAPAAGGPPAPTQGGAAAPTGPAPTPPPAPRGIGANLPPALGTASKETGKPLPTPVQSAIVRTLSMNDVINKALAALEPYKGSTSLDDTMALVAKYRAGTESDPLTLASAQLPDLAGLQQSASTLLGGASRAMKIYADRRQHTPRLPSGRQIMIAGAPGMNANRVSSLSQLRMGDEGGFDSPAQMYQKLANLRDVNNQFLKDIENAAEMRTQTTPSAQTPPSAATKDAQGNWIIHVP